jgi:hypothetical protein
MQDNTQKSIVILALNLSSELEDKKALTNFLGYEYKRQALDGCYKGTTEKSYILEVGNKTLEQILEFSKVHNQESILYLDNQRIATLVYSMDNMVNLGRFKGVSKGHALSKDAYTYSEELNQYYIVE